MVECDKCGSQIRDTRYPWYSYYSPEGEGTEILFRYCDESKRMLKKLYGIPEEYFSRAYSDIDERENRADYEESRISFIHKEA